jgi:RHS repeat-associated protein
MLTAVGDMVQAPRRLQPGNPEKGGTGEPVQTEHSPILRRQPAAPNDGEASRATIPTRPDRMDCRRSDLLERKRAEASVYQLTEAPGIVDEIAPSGSTSQTGTCYYFGGKMIKNEKGWVYTDRQGSIEKFYGVERPSAANGTEKFTRYLRDAETGLNYADQKHESQGTGRFMTPDRIAGNAADPGGWNRYAYAGSDPWGTRSGRL